MHKLLIGGDIFACDVPELLELIDAANVLVNGTVPFKPKTAGQLVKGACHFDGGPRLVLYGGTPRGSGLFNWLEEYAADFVEVRSGDDLVDPTRTQHNGMLGGYHTYPAKRNGDFVVNGWVVRSCCRDILRQLEEGGSKTQRKRAIREIKNLLSFAPADKIDLPPFCVVVQQN
jgi:hypothetical protein